MKSKLINFLINKANFAKKLLLKLSYKNSCVKFSKLMHFQGKMSHFLFLQNETLRTKSVNVVIQKRFITTKYQS